MIILKESNHINIDKFKKELRNKISEIATSEEFGFDDHEIDNYFYLDIEELDNGRIRVEVRAEVDYEGLEYLANELDPIIQKYDKNSYFEPVEPGIIDAYISDVKFLEESDQNDKRLSSTSTNVPETQMEESDSDDYVDDWIELASKSVEDSDGFYTDYTLYTNGSTYICMFGDKEIYEPDESYADYETESEQDAWDWFNSYTGFADEEDEDDVYGPEYLEFDFFN